MGSGDLVCRAGQMSAPQWYIYIYPDHLHDHLCDQEGGKGEEDKEKRWGSSSVPHDSGFALI